MKNRKAQRKVLGVPSNFGSDYTSACCITDGVRFDPPHSIYLFGFKCFQKQFRVMNKINKKLIILTVPGKLNGHCKQSPPPPQALSFTLALESSYLRFPRSCFRST